MKTRISITLFTFLLLYFNGSASAQRDYEQVHGATEYEYAVRGELVLDFHTNLHFKNIGSDIEKKYHLTAPLFLSFNRNDLKYFLDQPQKMAGYTDAMLSTTNYFSDSNGENEKFAGMMSAEEWTESNEGGVAGEKSAKGKIDQAIDIKFKMPGLEDALKSGNYKFRLFISAVSCPSCEQKNTTGRFQTEGFATTEGITLDISFSCGANYTTDLENAIIKAKMDNVGGSEKQKFIDSFEKEYFKEMPEIDAKKLMEFLINPQGTYEVPFSGRLISPDGSTENTTLKGTLRLFGNEVCKYWKE